MPPIRRIAAVLVTLTLALGATVAFSWLLFGGAAAFQGPDQVLARSWPWIYGSQAVLAVGVTWLIIRSRSYPVSAGPIALLVMASWIGELVALTAGGSLLANEIVPNVAYVFWWMGTGGPIQPAAAILGGLASRR